MIVQSQVHQLIVGMLMAATIQSVGATKLDYEHVDEWIKKNDKLARKIEELR